MASRVLVVPGARITLADDVDVEALKREFAEATSESSRFVVVPTRTGRVHLLTTPETPVLIEEHEPDSPLWDGEQAAVSDFDFIDWNTA